MELKGSSKEFIITEYIQLRSELMLCLQQIASTERNALIMSGIIWAWLATHPWNPTFTIVIFIPAMLTKLFEYKRESISDAISEIAQYVYKVEERFDVGEKPPRDIFGWEHREKKSVFKDWSKKYWLSLFWGNILIAVLYALSQLGEYLLNDKILK